MPICARSEGLEQYGSEDDKDDKDMWTDLAEVREKGPMIFTILIDRT